MSGLKRHSKKNVVVQLVRSSLNILYLLTGSLILTHMSYAVFYGLNHGVSNHYKINQSSSSSREKNTLLLMMKDRLSCCYLEMTCQAGHHKPTGPCRPSLTPRCSRRPSRPSKDPTRSPL